MALFAKGAQDGEHDGPPMQACHNRNPNHRSADELLGRQIPMIAEDPDLENMRAVVRALAHCLIWCPYMVVSKRVKATFLR